MKNVAKVAVSLPAKTLRDLDAARRRLGRSRSAIVSEAVNGWLAAQGEPSDEDRRYVEAYLRQPENAVEAGAIAAAATSQWEPWT